MTTKTEVDLDLDALAPKPVQIKYKDKLILVNPLSLEQFAKYFELAELMSKLKDSKDTKAIIEAIEKVGEYIKTVIPDLADETLNQMQITAIFSVLGDLNQTQDKALAELKKRGIELKKGVPKAPKASTS